MKARNDFRPVLSGRLILLSLLASVIVGLMPVPQPIGLLVVNGALLFLALVDRLLTKDPRSIVVERALPPVMALHDEGVVQWRAINPHRRRVAVSIADGLTPSLGAQRRRVQLRLPRRGAAIADTTICPTRRGRIAITHMTVRVSGPLGLVSRQGRRMQDDFIRVNPRFPSRQDAELRVQRARMMQVGLRSVRGVGGGTEFEQLREYGPDDDFRRIDWAATARSTKAIVRTYRPEQNQSIWVMLDCGRTMAGRVGDAPRLEHAMDGVMALTLVATRLGDKVGMTAFDQAVRGEVVPGSGTQQFARVTDAMYALEPELSESDYQGAFIHLLNRSRRRSLVVVFTELADEALNETLLPALPLLMRKHLVVIASVIDPDLQRWATSIPEDTTAAYRKAAAVTALDNRQRVAADLRRRGAVVIDAAPGKMAAHLADAYLAVKATGRL